MSPETAAGVVLAATLLIGFSLGRSYMRDKMEKEFLRQRIRELEDRE